MARLARDLQPAQEWLQSLVDSLDCILYEIDPATFRLTYVNENAERLLGYPVEEWLSPTFLAEHVHPEDRDWVFAFCRRETDAGRNHQFEYRLLAADGRIHWFCDMVTVVMRAGRARALRGVMLEITQRKQVDDQVRENEERSRLVMETARDAFIGTDLESRITDWNLQAERIFGWSRKEAIGASLPELIIPPRYQEAHRQSRRLFLDTGAGESFYTPRELTALHRDGHEFPVEVTLWPVRQVDTYAFKAFVHDISGRRRLEEERQRLTAGLQALAWRLLRLQEEERRRIANDLHDGALQMITGAQTYFETLMAKAGASDAVLAEGVHGYLTRALAECRGVIASMRPPVLEDFGLVEGLRRYLTDLNRPDRSVIEFQAGPAGCSLGETVESHLFRIVQEAVANALRHAGSDRVRVTLKRTPRRVVLKVEDWGSGFDVAAAQLQAGQHVGLLSMQERAALIGGRLAVRSAPGKGTTVTVELPLPSNPAHLEKLVAEKWIGVAAAERQLSGRPAVYDG